MRFTGRILMDPTWSRLHGSALELKVDMCDKCSGHHVFKLWHVCKLQVNFHFPLESTTTFDEMATPRSAVWHCSVFLVCLESWPAIASISGNFMAFLPSRRLFVAWVLGWQFHPTEALTFSQTDVLCDRFAGQWWMTFWLEKATKKKNTLLI